MEQFTTLDRNYLENEAKKITTRLIYLTATGKCIGNDKEYSRLYHAYRDLDKIYKLLTGASLHDGSVTA